MTKKGVESGKSRGAIAAQDGRDLPIKKNLTGISGFDEITGGGLPDNRLTAIIGSPGAGKTIFGLQTLVNRIRANGTAAIFVTFEEPIAHIRGNIAAFDWEFANFGENGLSFIDARIPPDAVLSGAFDLIGLLTGLSALAAETGARDVIFDGIDMFLSGLQDEQLERQELTRLDDWVRRSSLSAMITVKSLGLGQRDQLRADFLQYMTDCVVTLDAVSVGTIASRSLRVVKYRGSGFAANPVPVVIGRSGFDVLAFKGARTNYPTFADRVSSGIPRLDSVLDGGYVRGSSVLISGAPGTSKTSLGASFAAAACDRGEKALFVSFDESGAQIIANMQSIGLKLKPHVAAGRLVIESLLSSGRSPEEHFITICNLLKTHAPQCLVIDPLSALLKGAYPFATIICESLLDQAKSRGITVLCTSLLEQVSGDQEFSASNVSTVADTWIHVSYVAFEGERNRAITIIKSRGTNHSNQVRELVLSSSGIDLLDVYIAEGEVMMGSARAQREAEMGRQNAKNRVEHQRLQIKLDKEIEDLKSRMLAISRELSWKQQEAELSSVSEVDRIEQDRVATMARLNLRRVDDDTNTQRSTRGARRAR